MITKWRSLLFLLSAGFISFCAGNAQVQDPKLPAKPKLAVILVFDQLRG